MQSETTVIIVRGTRSGPTPPATAKTPANVQEWSFGSAESEPSVAALAAALTAFETEVSDRQPAEIVLADASDAALAATLVGAKLPVPVTATERARDPASANGRLIAQLAGAYTAPA